MPSTYSQYDEVSQEDHIVNKQLSSSLTTDSPKSSEEQAQGLMNKIAPSNSRLSYTSVSHPVSSDDQQNYTTQRIHWAPPAMMIVSLLCGVALSVGHHYYYSKLNDQEAGSSERQQWSLRFGNAFAVSTSLCLKTAVGTAYLQVLWRRLSKSHTSIRAINAAFDIPGNFLSFFNPELWKKMQIGVLLAFVLWCLPISTLLAPPTLSVRQKSESSFQMLPILTLNMGNSEQFASLRTDRDIEMAPTPQLKRLAAIVAYSGEIMPFESPSLSPNASYRVMAFTPLVRCQAANSTEQFRLLKGASDMRFAPSLTTNNSAKWSSTAKFRSGETGYLAVYDEYDEVTTGENYEVFQPVIFQKRVPIYDSILVALQRKNTSSEYQSDTEYIRCQLWNTTLEFSVNITSGRSKVENVKTTWQNRINADIRNHPGNPFGYLYYFLAVANYVIGRGQYYTQDSDRSYSNFTMAGDVFGSTLSFNSQFRDMAMDLALHSGSNLTRQTVNRETVRNTSFGQDLEQLALNTSISLFTDLNFSKYKSTNVTSQTTLTVYAYQPRNLFISYGFAILFSAFSVGLGLYSMYRNGASYNASFSSISVSMQNKEVIKLLEQANTTTAQPLNKQAGTIRLRFRPGEDFIAKDMRGRDLDA